MIKRLVLMVLGLAVILIALSEAGDGPPPNAGCEYSSGTDFPSPDQQHIARRIECIPPSGFGGSPTAQIVAIRDAAESEAEGATVFTSFDDPPEVSWQGNNRVVVTVIAVSTISKSRHSARGVEVDYAVSEQLTEEYARFCMKSQQDWNVNYFKKKEYYEDINGNLKNRYKKFIMWAKANAGMK